MRSTSWLTCSVDAACWAHIRALETVVRHVTRADWPTSVERTSASSTIGTIRVTADHTVWTWLRILGAVVPFRITGRTATRRSDEVLCQDARDIWMTSAVDTRAHLTCVVIAQWTRTSAYARFTVLTCYRGMKTTNTVLSTVIEAWKQ